MQIRYDMIKWHMQIIASNCLLGPILDFIYCLEKNITMVSSNPVIYNLSLIVYRNIRKKHKAWKGAADNDGESDKGM